MNDKDDINKKKAADKKIESYSQSRSIVETQQASQSEHAKIQVQELSLPQGGGAVRGMGESFRADEFTGTAQFDVPLKVTPCRDFEPKLSLTYSSAAGKGSFGLGFDIALPRIGRKTTTGVPRYTDEDSFIGPGGETLVIVKGSEREETLDHIVYRVITLRPRIESSFLRIEQWQNKSTQAVFWKTTDTSNVTAIYGKTTQAVIADPAQPERVYQWLLEWTYDAKGNCRHYVYKAENTENLSNTIWEHHRTQSANKYIQHIYYGNTEPYTEGDAWPQNYLFDIAFDYGEYKLAEIDTNHAQPVQDWACRQDSFSNYVAGFEIRTHRLCHGILLFHSFSELGQEPVLVRATTFDYQQSPTLSLLSSAQITGYRFYNDSYTQQSQPALLFSFSEFQPLSGEFTSMQRDDGRALASVGHPPDYTFVDLYSEGVPGVLYADQQSVMYFSPQLSEADVSKQTEINYSEPLVPATFPLPRSVSSAGLQLLDIDGDGQLELLQVDDGTGSLGYYKVQAEGGWKNYMPLACAPNVLSEPGNQWVDLVNNGLADIAQFQSEQVRWYSNQPGEGFVGPQLTLNQQALPASSANDAKSLWTFTDLLGGGTQSLVRIGNGRVECWPGVGYGAFAPPVLLGRAPNFGEDFDRSRLFLADLDGNGLVDLVYCYENHAAIYLNESGNQFAEPFNISLPTPWSQIAQVSFADVDGNGAAAMIISNSAPEPKHWSYNFIANGKPYLLTQSDNQSGSKTSIHYKASTHFYLEDKAQGIEWLTRLPFPVQVVASTQHVDALSGTVEERSYRYRDGYFDPHYREFRGFGYVERQDAAVLSLSSQPYDVPPVLTKSWYHTGVYDTDSYYLKVSETFYQGDSQAYLLPDSLFTFLTDSPLASDYSAAHRALKGRLLHQEVYAPSAPLARSGEQADAPYSVSSYRYQVQQIQKANDASAGIYAAHQLESTEYDYERNPSDPGFKHQFILAVDAFGQVLKTCEVTYPRRGGQADTLPAQLQLLSTCRLNQYIPLADIEGSAYLPSLPQSQQAYQITGLALAPNKLAFTWSEVSTAVNQALTGAGNYSAELFQWQQLDYKKNVDKKVMPQGLLVQQGQAVFSSTNIENIFSAVLDKTALSDLLSQEGGYVLDSGYWWNPGLSQQYFGFDQFYQIQSVTDMFSAVTTYEYDSYALLLKLVSDALGNTTQVKTIDYQTLAAIDLLDINNNTSEVRYDALGRVYLSSFYGTEKGVATGFAPLPDAAALLPPDLQGLIDNPHTYLQGGAAYCFYNLDSYHANGTPVYTATLKADTYASDSAVEIEIVYSDGQGRELQTKTKVNPGKAYCIGKGGSVSWAYTDHRWLNSGRKIYNNKGDAVKTFDPVYVNTEDYIDTTSLDKFGEAATTFYDPLGREIRVDTAKGFFTKTEYTPWQIIHYDADDTVKDSSYYKENIGNPDLNIYEKKALEQAALFYDTPSSEILDGLGRTIQKHEINTLNGTDKETYINDFVLDIQGNVIQSADPRLFEAGLYNFTNAYSLTGDLLKVIGVDSGTLWSINNALDNPLYNYNSRGFASTYTYDALQRPTLLTVTGGDGESALNNIIEKRIYGESQAHAQDHNLRGQLYQQYDSAGLLQFNDYSIQTQALSLFRQLRAEYTKEANWTGDLSKLLLAEQYSTGYTYNALQRVSSETDADANQYLPEYNLGGSLSRISLDSGGVKQVYVDRIDYTAAGQRLEVDYGNGVQTQYEYESTTRRLTHVNSTRLSDKKVLQALWYVYDPVGNITHCKDGAWDSIFNKQQQVKPEADYTYDALYRLVSGSGREHPALAENPYRREGNYPEAGYVSLQDGQQLSNYQRFYYYDKGGNLERIQHQGTQSFNYEYTIATNSNRSVEKSLTDDPAQVDHYFDACGNQIQLVSISSLAWNFRNGLAKASVVIRENAEDDAEYYVYAADGERVRKVNQRSADGHTITHIEDSRYLGNLQIYLLTQNKNVIEERHSKPILDDQSRVATRLQWLVGNPPQGVSNPQDRYTLANNIGSAVLELDNSGKLISYEEYYPFGGTSVIAGNNYKEVKLNQYRYSGKENDTVTGLYYYGARYYAPWKCRWLSPDPTGAVDGLNLYLFVNNNPVANVDTNGRWLFDMIQNNLNTVSTVIGVGSTLAGAPWAGAVINAGLAYSMGGANLSGIGLQLVAGTLAGYVAGPLASRAAIQLGLGRGSASSFIFQGAFSGAITGAVTGGTMARYQQVQGGKDHPAVPMSVLQGAAYGGLKGAAMGTLVASSVATYKYFSSTTLSAQDQAAARAINRGNPQSIRDNLEYGGFVYRNPDGSYGYTEPVQGTDQGFDPRSAAHLVPRGSRVIGDYHTHGEYSLADPATGAAIRTGDPARDAFNSDQFSGPDIRGITADARGDANYRGYLGTPSGTYRALDPVGGNDYVIKTPTKWPWEP